MLEIIPPPFGVENVVRACGTADSVQPLLDGVETLKTQEASYLAHVVGGTLDVFPKRPTAITDSIADAANSAYTSRLRSKASDARGFYDYMRLTAPNGLCPNCMVRDAAALDHHLPREHFPALAIQPSNLVPICTSCNLKKSSHVAANPSDRFLHPYFDRLGAWDWIRADVVEVEGSPLIFRIAPHASWDSITEDRVRRHVERFDLLHLFGEKAAALLGNLRVAFESHWTDAPEGAREARVALEASRLARSHAAKGRAPWQAAAFTAWSESAWFCDRGWRTVDDESVLRAALASLKM